MMPKSAIYLLCLLFAAAVLGMAGCGTVATKSRPEPQADPYADYVWPPPPDEARIRLEGIIRGRADVEAHSSFRRKLLGASPQSPYDTLQKPFAVAFDAAGRILVTDSATGALIRFDRDGRRMDVLGTQGRVHLRVPLGLHVGRDGTIYVADVMLKRVVAFDPDGDLVAVYGHDGDLANPTDAALTPDGSRLLVTDSRGQQIVVFDTETGDRISAFGTRGDGEGQFNFPTSLAFDSDGYLYVVDQINSRVQVFDTEGTFLDQFGRLGVDFASFVRPKDIAVDQQGLIYVTDNAFNNVQLFDADFSLLTFVGEGGTGPGQFHGASGIAVNGDEFAVVDQLGRRVQVFRFVEPRSG